METFDAEEEQFEAGIDALRRRSMEGAEIICIINWSSDPNSNAPKETEVVRLPRRTVLTNPAAPKNAIELVVAPNDSAVNPSAAYAPMIIADPSQVGQVNGAPATTAGLPDARVIK